MPKESKTLQQGDIKAIESVINSGNRAEIMLIKGDVRIYQVKRKEIKKTVDKTE